MKKIMTVRGEIDANEIKNTSMHEHILLDASVYADVYEKLLKEFGIPLLPEKKLAVKMENLADLKRGYFTISRESFVLDNVEEAIEEVNHYKDVDGNAMMDITPAGIRGDIRGLKRISEETGIHIIAVAGLYADEFWPPECHEMTEEELEAYIEREVIEGIDGSGIKPGHIKLGCNYVNEKEKKALRAGVRVAKKTGYAVSIHSGVQMTIEDTMKMVELCVDEEGLDPSKLVLCHMDAFVLNSFEIKDIILNHEEATKLNLEPLKKLMNKGVTISLDMFGAAWDTELIGIENVRDYDRIRALVALIKDGYSSQIVLGHDLYTKFSYKKYGGHGYTRVLGFVIPMLREIEIPEKDIENILINNPRRILSY